MRIRHLALIALTLLSLASAPAQAREKPIPKTEDKFTSYLADRFAEALPTAKVTVKGPLELEVVVQKGPHQVLLGRVWDFCARDRRHCRKEVDSFLETMPHVLVESTDDPKTADIRVVVRTTDYIEQLRRMGAAGSDHQAVFRQVAGNLWMVCVIDMSHGISTMTHGEMAKFHLTEDAAFALGLKNLAAALPPLAEHSHGPKGSTTKYAFGDFYESSRMLLHDSWADMAKVMGGHLVIAVPSNDFLIYGDGTTKADRVVMGGLAHEVLAETPKPISGDLFEWTPTGWRLANP